jgi:hypothetical protein
MWPRGSANRFLSEIYEGDAPRIVQPTEECSRVPGERGNVVRFHKPNPIRIRRSAAPSPGSFVSEDLQSDSQEEVKRGVTEHEGMEGTENKAAMREGMEKLASLALVDNI